VVDTRRAFKVPVRRLRPADSTFADATLRVRASRTTGTWQTVPRDQWSVRDHTATVPSGFTPGLAYEFSYTAANPPIAGLGFAAIRDTAAWLRNHPRAAVPAITPVHHAYAFGISQSGRFLRDFLYTVSTPTNPTAPSSTPSGPTSPAPPASISTAAGPPRSLGLTAVAASPSPTPP